MTLLSLQGSQPPAAIRRLSPWKQRVLTRYSRARDARMLHRTQGAVRVDDWPDPSYWTAYDHFVIEREAQALRRAYAWALIARGWQRLTRALRLRT